MHALDRIRHHALIGEHEKYPWKPMPWRGIYNKVLFCDAILGTTIELAKIEKGATFPVHYHPTMQTLFLLSGLIRTEDQKITPGMFNVIPAASGMAAILPKKSLFNINSSPRCPCIF